MMTENPATIVA